MDQKLKQWLLWLQEIQAIAQIGRTYCDDYFCQERYHRLLEIAAEIGEQYAETDHEKIMNLFSAEKGYATPKVDVRGVVFKDNKILMVKEESDSLWSLPGGWADIDTSAGESVVREVFEETGYIVEAKKLLAFYDKHKHDHPPQWPHAYKAFFLCELKGGSEKLSYETLAISFFKENELPDLSRDRITKDEIHHMFEHARHPDWPTDFD